ncbi:hypothetical protein ALO82_200055 [Pseudomonas syringae pv. broussonetiae]|nr:hypothetical protein ALO82_200055 [Pseudomonas syringae pv. broussonetiae]
MTCSRTRTKVKLVALAGLTVLSLQMSSVHAEDDARLVGGIQQGQGTAGAALRSCCTPNACIQPCP